VSKLELEEALTSELQSITGLTKSVYPITAPQGTKGPYLVYTPMRASYEMTIMGEDLLKEQEIQIDYYHSSYSNLKALKKLIKSKIRSFNLRAIGNNGPYVQQCEIFNEFETYENIVPLYKGIVEIKFYFKEA
jgi:hypothetical protein